jgi:hypothetical protein
MIGFGFPKRSALHTVAKFSGLPADELFSSPHDYHIDGVSFWTNEFTRLATGRLECMQYLHKQGHTLRSAEQQMWSVQGTNHSWFAISPSVVLIRNTH